MILNPNVQSAPPPEGFTLAEVLITLGIIGIVCAMTLTTLIADHREKQTVVRLKHTHSLLTQAFNIMISENGTLNTWSDESREFLGEELVKYLKIAKICEANASCSGFNWQNTPTYVLSNGVAIHITYRYPNSGSAISCTGEISNVLSNKGSYYNKCSGIEIDINGRGNPNKSGYDIFYFDVFTDGIIPSGTISKKGASWIDTFDDACNPGKLYNTDNKTCTAWVIYHENMDYLKCRDKLSWTGPYSCKEANKK